MIESSKLRLKHVFAIFVIQFLQIFRDVIQIIQSNKSKVSELKAEQQQLDGLCLALRRAVHAEGLIMEVWGWIF